MLHASSRSQAPQHPRAAEQSSESDPHPLFDTAYYLAQVPDIATSRESPLEHYFRVGARAGLDPHPLFWSAYYLERYAAEGDLGNPLIHFLEKGAALGFDPNPFFATRWYEETYPDVRRSGLNALVHYASYGAAELLRQPHPCFPSETYALRRKLARGTNPLVDFVIRYRARYRSRLGSEAPLSPEHSIVVLNFNKALLTLQSVLEIFESRGVGELEIVVVDNGSNPNDIHWLTRWLPDGVRVIRLRTNRYFGEGNNIGACASRGDFVVFLNNDAFLEPDTIRSLTDVFALHGDAGAVGPKFLYPNGTIQEAGAFVSSCGLVTQRGKYLQNMPERYSGTQVVDYVSAACVLIPRQYLDAVGGFDFSFEPAYYEDVDLCYKLRLLGLLTYYCGETDVTHMEGATSSDATLGLRLGNVSAVNREKFNARWGDFIESNGGGRSHVKLARPKCPDARIRELPLAIVATPYDLTPGGGERYVLSMVETLALTYRVLIATPERYSAYRLPQLANELQLDLPNVELITVAEIPAQGECELFVSIGNEVLPQVEAAGRVNIYVCQFPFPMHPNHVAAALTNLDGYQAVLAYSAFSARMFEKRAAEVLSRYPPVFVLEPAVPMYADAPGRRAEGRILTVGRFTRGGHCKRQDALVRAFRMLYERTGRADLELHLVGTLPPDPASRQYYVELCREAGGLHVYFHPHASSATMRELYETSSYYWHATGFGHDANFAPEFMEHFGISVLEAMSSGTIPLVYGFGGPAETVTDGVTGKHWRTLDELVSQTALLLGNGAACDGLRAAGAVAARRFERTAFDAKFAAQLGRILAFGLGGRVAVPSGAGS
jgi:GT2 family glycosyltransferase/glycosyltransferase involved in cell wall biosynthesis